MPPPTALRITPGQWIAQLLAPRVTHILGGTDAMGARPTVAVVDDIYMEANAALIVEAPAMFHAAWKLLDVLAPIGNLIPPVRRAMAELRAVLIRAAV